MTEMWMPHSTDERPVAKNVWVDVMRFNGTVDYALPAGGWNWHRNPSTAGPSNIGIGAYRISNYQPKAADHDVIVGGWA